MIQPATLISPSQVFMCPQILEQIVIFDSSLFSLQLKNHFVESDKETHLVSEMTQFNQLLSQDFQPDVLFLEEELISKGLLKLGTLKKKWPQTLIFLILESVESPLIETSVQNCSGSIFRELTQLNFINLLLFQAYEKKRLENRNQFLEHSLKETQKELQAVNAELQKEEASKSLFIKNLSSNLQQPLDQLVQFSHIALQRLQRRQFTQVSHYLAEVKMITEETMSYIQDLMEIALLKSDESVFHIEEIDIVEFLRTIKRQFQPIADSRDVTLHFQNQVDHPCAKGDFNKLSKVINILLRSIFKIVSKNGAVKLKTFQNNSFFEISIGEIPDLFFDKVDKQLFDIFNITNYRESGENRDLGLSICKELMRGQGGEIRIEQDDLTKGARFILSLPKSENFFDELTS